MHTNDKEMRVRVDAFTRFCLAAIGVLLIVLIAGLWGSAIPSTDAVAAESFADTSAQRKDMADVQKQIVDKLDELIVLLKSGQVKVQMVQDKQARSGIGGASVVPTSTKQK